MKKLLYSIFALSLLVSVSACRETTEEKAEDTMESVGDDMEDAAEDTEDAIEDAGDEIEAEVEGTDDDM